MQRLIEHQPHPETSIVPLLDPIERAGLREFEGRFNEPVNNLPPTYRTFLLKPGRVSPRKPYGRILHKDADIETRSKRVAVNQLRTPLPGETLDTSNYIPSTDNLLLPEKPVRSWTLEDTSDQLRASRNGSMFANWRLSFQRGETPTIDPEVAGALFAATGLIEPVTPSSIEEAAKAGWDCVYLSQVNSGPVIPALVSNFPFGGEEPDTPSDYRDTKFLKELLRQSLLSPTPREREAISLYFGFSDGISRSSEEIATALGCSPKEVAALVDHGLEKLRHPGFSPELQDLLS